MVSTSRHDQFAALLGVTEIERSFDKAICRVTVGDAYRNALGGIHGGLIFSLADIAFAAACNAGDATYIGLQADIKYIAAAQGDTLMATATRRDGTRRFAHYQVVVTDEQGTRLALFTGTAYKLSQ